MANTIEYKGYIGSIEYSSEDKCFFGKLEMIDDLVTFESDNAHELETNFHNCVDEYLQTCKELGREPQKAYKEDFEHNSISSEEVKKKVQNAINNVSNNNGIEFDEAFDKVLNS